MKRQVFGISLSIWGAVAFAIFAAFIFVPNLSTWKSTQLQALDDIKNELALLEQRAEQLSRESSLIKNSQTDALKWRAESLGVATAQIQAQVSEFAVSSGLALRSMAPTGEGELANTTTVTFRLEAEAALDRLVSFLQALEYGQPVVLVQEVNIRRLNRPGLSGQQPLVFVQLALSAPVGVTREEQ